MGLAIFGLVLLGALGVMCWKKWSAVFVAVLAVMLGITIASSGGMLHQPSQDFTNWVRAGIGTLGDKVFGGGQ
jgi:hypothetical protein